MIEKLILDKNVWLIDVPYVYLSFFTQVKTNQSPYDVILAFVVDLQGMDNHIRLAEEKLVEHGILYLAYPKIKNILGLKGIHRDAIFPYLNVNEETGYVKKTFMRFNKMVSLDENYTILGIKKDSARKKRDKVSQRVDDYIGYLELIKTRLINDEALTFFNKITLGYQKNWARYIYSAKTIETQNRRFQEMKILLKQGIKSRDLVGKNWYEKAHS